MKDRKSETKCDNHIHKGQSSKAPFALLFFSHFHTFFSFKLAPLYLYTFNLSYNL